MVKIGRSKFKHKWQAILNNHLPPLNLTFSQNMLTLRRIEIFRYLMWQHQRPTQLRAQGVFMIAGKPGHHLFKMDRKIKELFVNWQMFVTGHLSLSKKVPKK
jgi:hypothetical protein